MLSGPLAVPFLLAVFAVGYWYVVVTAEWAGVGPGNEADGPDDPD